MMPYKSLYIKLFSVCMKKYMKEQYGPDITKAALKKAPSIYRDNIHLIKLSYRKGVVSKGNSFS